MKTKASIKVLSFLVIALFLSACGTTTNQGVQGQGLGKAPNADFPFGSNTSQEAAQRAMLRRDI